MHKHFQISIIIGILALSSGQALSAKSQASQGNSEKKKLAIALPKEQNKEETSVSSAVLVTPSNPMTAPIPSASPAAKYAGLDANSSSAIDDLAVSVGSGSRQIGTNISGPADLVSAIQDVAQRGFQRAERITGAYDKRLSQLIAWLANSFMPSTTITPINSPSLCSKQRHFKIADGVSREEKRRAYLFN